MFLKYVCKDEMCYQRLWKYFKISVSNCELRLSNFQDDLIILRSYILFLSRDLKSKLWNFVCARQIFYLWQWKKIEKQIEITISKNLIIKQKAISNLINNTLRNWEKSINNFLMSFFFTIREIMWVKQFDKHRWQIYLYSEQKFNTQKAFIAEIKTFSKNSMLRMTIL